MKKLLLTVFTLILTLNLSNAYSIDDFEISKSSYEDAFKELTSLESYVMENSYTLTDLSTKNNLLITKLQLDTNYSAMSTLEGAEPPLGIPSFVWGLCCGVSGIAIVYFISENTDETKKALNGCLVSGAIYAAVYLAAILSSTATTY